MHPRESAAGIGMGGRILVVVTMVVKKMTVVEVFGVYVVRTVVVVGFAWHQQIT